MTVTLSQIDIQELLCSNLETGEEVDNDVQRQNGNECDRDIDNNERDLIHKGLREGPISVAQDDRALPKKGRNFGDRQNESD